MRPKPSAKRSKKRKPDAIVDAHGRLAAPPHATTARVKERRLGRPAVVPNWELVERLAFLHCSIEEIAYGVGMSVEALQNDRNGPIFGAILDRSRARLREQLRRTQIHMALGDPGAPADKKKKIPARPPVPPDKTMLIWLGKQYLGQRDTPAEATVIQPSDQPIRNRTITIHVGEDDGEA